MLSNIQWLIDQQTKLARDYRLEKDDYGPFEEDVFPPDLEHLLTDHDGLWANDDCSHDGLGHDGTLDPSRK